MTSETINSRPRIAVFAGTVREGRNSIKVAEWAVQTLKAAGIDADDPAHVARIDAVMGEGVWQRIDAVRAQRADLERALDTTERLTRPQERS